jgi:hypothetical protein
MADSPRIIIFPLRGSLLLWLLSLLLDPCFRGSQNPRGLRVAGVPALPYIRFSIQVDTDDSEPSRVVPKIHGMVFDYAEGSEQEVKLGEVDAFLLLTALAAEKGESIFDAMDSISDATTECYGAVFDPNSDDWNSAVLDLYTGGPMSSDLLFIDRISLDEKYRGKGIGALVVRETIDTFGLHCGLVVCKPFPLQYSGWKENVPLGEQAKTDFEAQKTEAFARVAKFWSDLEFVKLPESDFYAYSPELSRQPDPDQLKSEQRRVVRGRRRSGRTRKRP